MHRQRSAVGSPVEIQRRAPLHRQWFTGRPGLERRGGIHEEQGQPFRGCGRDSQLLPVRRPLDIVRGTLRDGQRGLVHKGRSADAGGRFQRVQADLSVAGRFAPQERNGDTGPIRRPHGPAVHGLTALGLGQDSASASNRAGRQQAAARTVGIGGYQLAVVVDVCNAVDMHRGFIIRVATRICRARHRASSTTTAATVRHQWTNTGIQGAVVPMGHGINFARTRVTVASNIPISNGGRPRRSPAARLKQGSDGTGRSGRPRLAVAVTKTVV